MGVHRRLYGNVAPMFFDPRFRTVYQKVADAPRPEKDDQYICIEFDGGRWFQDYVSREGQWVRYGLPFKPAEAG